jgi:hypothetical protein
MWRHCVPSKLWHPPKKINGGTTKFSLASKSQKLCKELFVKNFPCLLKGVFQEDVNAGQQTGSCKTNYRVVSLNIIAVNVLSGYPNALHGTLVLNIDMSWL